MIFIFLVFILNLVEKNISVINTVESKNIFNSSILTNDFFLYENEEIFIILLLEEAQEEDIYKELIEDVDENFIFEEMNFVETYE